jgi:hypothetical protein
VIEVPYKNSIIVAKKAIYLYPYRERYCDNVVFYRSVAQRCEMNVLYRKTRVRCARSFQIGIHNRDNRNGARFNRQLNLDNPIDT